MSISAIDPRDIPHVEAPVRQRRPESAFAKRQMRSFLDSDCMCAEVTDIPDAYDTTRLYEALKNAVWSLCSRPCVRVTRRKRRIFLIWEGGDRNGSRGSVADGFVAEPHRVAPLCVHRRRRRNRWRWTRRHVRVGERRHGSHTASSDREKEEAHQDGCTT